MQHFDDALNLFSFLTHLQAATAYQMHDIARILNRLNILPPKHNSNIVNESRIKACLSRLVACAYNHLQFLRAVSHSVGAHTVALQPATDNDSNDDDDEQSTASTATTSTAPEPAAAVADEPADCCEVCLVAWRTFWSLGHIFGADEARHFKFGLHIEHKEN